MLYFLSRTGLSPRISSSASRVGIRRISSGVISSRPVNCSLMELEPLRPRVWPRVRMLMVSLPSSFDMNSSDSGSLPPPKNSSVSQLPMMLWYSSR